MERGRLKIFFGYSAGVGKAYAMLKSAGELKAAGVDVVLGYLEPHDRPETLAMAEGLERLPLKEVNYKGIVLKEFDVDAALSRHPELLLVDELAHTNAPGCRNRKRYLDIEELVNAGIDVYTTVNVQHIEGLHDLVDSATSVDVSECIPDEIFDYADEVALIDVEPSELIERMKEGKIYKKTKAAAALENFFNRDNLYALRELTMRRSADRIEKLTNNGELKSKVLVLISPSPSSSKGIRVAARQADAYHCKFSAMYVETGGELSDKAAENIKKHMKLVRDLGGEMVVKYGENIVDTVADYVKLAGVTNLVLGKTWQSVGKKNGLEDRFIVRLPNVEILIVPDNEHLSMRRNTLLDFFSVLFSRNKLLRKYKTANRILDISNLIAQAVAENDGKRAVLRGVAEVLSRAFSRGTMILSGKFRVECSFEGESTAVFSETKECAVAEWCVTNGKSAGRGTDTLRDAKGTYFPIKARRGYSVVAFDCSKVKLTVTERLIFNQLNDLLKIVL